TQTQDLIRQTLQSGGIATPAGGGGFGGGAGARGGRRGGRDAEEAELTDGDEFQRGQRRRPQGGGGLAPAALTEVSAAARRAAVQKVLNGDVPAFIQCTDASATNYALN